MKTKFISAASAAIAALSVCSCNRIEQTQSFPALSGSLAELNLRISTQETKTTVRSDAMDRAINSVAILVFDDLGRVENSFFGNVDEKGKLSGSIRTSMGIKTICAFANGSNGFKNKLKNISELHEIDYLTSSLNDDNASDSFLMAGKAEDVDVNASSFDLTMEISRLVGRIEIHKITHAITEETDKVTAAMRFVVKGIYLINVPGDMDFSGGNPTVWHNKLQCNNEDLTLYADHNIDKVLTKSESYTTPHYFYCYPNPFTNSGCTDKEWCPRPTRLVIECWIGDEGEENACYYSFEMPDARKNPDVTKLTSNKTYSVTSCKITRKGSENPWEDVPVGSISITISVTDWETGANYEYTI